MKLIHNKKEHLELRKKENLVIWEQVVEQSKTTLPVIFLRLFTFFQLKNGFITIIIKKLY